jgi:hypothetical protein
MPRTGHSGATGRDSECHFRVLMVWQFPGEGEGWDCLTFGGQAAAAKVGWVSFAGENLCPKVEPKVPL